MNYETHRISDIERRLDFTVPAEEVDRRLDRAVEQLRRRVRLPGYRPGRASARKVERRFRKQLQESVIQELVNEAWRDVADRFEVLGQPRIEPGELGRGRDYTFSIRIEVKPEVELKTYRGIEVTYPLRRVTDEEVEAVVRSRLQGQASLAEVTETRPLRAGDVVLAALTITDGDETVHEHVGTMIRLQGDDYYRGIESLLVGADPSAPIEGEVTFDEGAQIEELRGRTLQVRAEVQMVQEPRVPELTDELAEELGYEGGAEGMRQAIRAELEERAHESARIQARANLVQALIDANPFDVPFALVEQQFRALQEQLRLQAAMQGRDPRKLSWSDEELQQMIQQATFAAKGTLILERVAELEGIEVTDEDIDAKLRELAEQRGQQVEAIRAYFESEEDQAELRARILEEKTLEWLVEHAELKERDPAELAAEQAARLMADQEEAAGEEGAPAEQDGGEESAEAAPEGEEAAPEPPGDESA